MREDDNRERHSARDENSEATQDNPPAETMLAMETSADLMLSIVRDRYEVNGGMAAPSATGDGGTRNNADRLSDRNHDDPTTMQTIMATSGHGAGVNPGADRLDMPGQNEGVKLQASQILALVGDETIVDSHESAIGTNEKELPDTFSSRIQKEQRNQPGQGQYKDKNQSVPDSGANEISLEFTESTTMSNNMRMTPPTKELQLEDLPSRNGNAMSKERPIAGLMGDRHSSQSHLRPPTDWEQSKQQRGRNAVEERQLAQMHETEKEMSQARMMTQANIAGAKRRPSTQTARFLTITTQPMVNSEERGGGQASSSSARGHNQSGPVALVNHDEHAVEQAADLNEGILAEADFGRPQTGMPEHDDELIDAVEQGSSLYSDSGVGTSEIGIPAPIAPAPPRMHTVSAVLVTDNDDDLDEMRSKARREGEEAARRQLGSAGVAVKVTAVEAKSLCSPRLIIVGIILLVVAIGGIVGVILALQSSNSDTPAIAPPSSDGANSGAPSTLTTLMPTMSLAPSSQPTIFFATPAEKEAYLLRVKIAKAAAEVSGEALIVTDGTRRNAVQWLQHEDRTITFETPDAIIAERYIMVLMYDMLGGSGWTLANTFKAEDETTCQWGSHVDIFSQLTILECDEDSRITDIFARDGGPTGNLPSELGGLGRLTSMRIGTGAIRGTIPTEFGNLSLLTRFSLSPNLLSGKVPSELGRLINLQWIYLNHNKQLTGTLPSSLASLPNLSELMVHITGIDYVQNMCDAGLNIDFFVSDCLEEGIDCDCCSVCCRLNSFTNEMVCE